MTLKDYEYYREPAGVIYCGDCLDILPLIERGSVDLVLTDPPYGTGGRHGSVHLNKPDISGNRISRDANIWTQRQSASFCYKVTKCDAHSYVFCDWRSYLDFKIAWESGGWELRSLIIWNKKNGMGEYWRSSHEFILWFTKLKPRCLTGGGYFNVVEFAPIKGRNKKHPAEKPVDLLQYLCEASGGDTVLDPYLGSGPIVESVIKLGRKFIGIEIEPRYCEIAKQRLAQEELF